MNTVSSGAVISSCEQYRYALWRRWGEGTALVWIMLNPSKADAEQDDPTIRVVCGRSRLLGYSGAVVMNLFAYRATSPADMMSAADPVGPDNDRTLLKVRTSAGPIVCAWGAHGGHRGRDRRVLSLLMGKDLAALRLTKDGHPCHPLRIPYSEPLVPYDQLR